MQTDENENENKKHKQRWPYLSLWLLLAAALAIFVVVSFFDGIDLGFYHLKGSAFKEQLTHIPDTMEDADTMATDSVIEPEGPKIVLPDSTVKSVLLFGDSMTALLARRLADYGELHGYKVSSVTWDGSSTRSWSTSERLPFYIDSIKPDFIIISLGGNEINIADTAARAKDVRKMLGYIKVPYIWVGPPMKPKTDKYEKMVKAIIPEGAYFKSDLELPLGPDHIHPTIKGGVIWMDSIMRWMPSTPHPILYEMPDSVKPKGSFKHIYFNARNKRVH